MTGAAVHARAMAVDLGDRRVLEGVDLHLHGGHVAVLGANGSGKTTLLRCLATVLAPSHGALTFDGLSPRRESERIEIRRRLGYLPQDAGFTHGARVADVVEYLAVLKGIDDDRTRRVAVFDVLERVGMHRRAASTVDELSGGERRRVALAQALLGSPSLLVIDEPTAGLDPDERTRVLDIVNERRQRATVVASTHLIGEASTADRVLVVAEGTVCFDGSPESLRALATGRTWVERGLPPPGVRASRRLDDGTVRCLGSPPPGAELVEPTVEDGYLLLTGPSAT